MDIDMGGLDDWGKKIPYDENLLKVIEEGKVRLPRPDDKDAEEDPFAGIITDEDIAEFREALAAMPEEERMKLEEQFGRATDKVLKGLGDAMAALDELSDELENDE